MRTLSGKRKVGVRSFLRSEFSEKEHTVRLFLLGIYHMTV